FLKSEEAYKSTELPRGEFPDKGQRTSYRGNRPPRAAYGGGQQRTDNHNTFNRKDHYQLYVSPEQATRGARAGRVNHREARGQSWMNTPITFPLVLADDVSNEPLVIEAEVEGPFGPNLDEASGFLWRATDSNEEGGIGSSIRKMRELRAVSSTIHAMIKFPTPKGIATLVARATSVFKCRRLEKKQAEQERKTEEVKPGRQGELAEEEILINPAFLEQKVTIRKQFSKECRFQLINLLKRNMDVFAWQPSDMTGVPKRIMKHTLNVNLSIPPVEKKRRVLGT
ncbi:hypothetical protein Tco_1083855, partial [Tanacetum coccineum]